MKQLTSLPPLTSSLPHLPSSMPKDMNTIAAKNIELKKAVLFNTCPSTITNDPTGWDESWFASYE